MLFLEGWIKLHRKIRENPVIFSHPNLLRLWVICLTEATYTERDYVTNNKTIKLKPGQFVTGRNHIQDLYHENLKPSERVKGEKTVYSWLEKLQKLGCLSIEKTTKYSIVTIDNWETYQNDKVQAASVEDEEIDLPDQDNIPAFDQIEKKFIRYRRSGFSLTPTDVQAISRLLKKDIPLEKILKWMDEVNAKYVEKHGGKTITSFGYYEKAIMTCWERHQNSSNVKPFPNKQDNLSKLDEIAKKKGWI
jgi:hypothetical protein